MLLSHVKYNTFYRILVLFSACVLLNAKQNYSGFVVVAIFKDEATNFKEWISHYLWQGASHFYLIDNGSTDDWESTIPKKVHTRITVTRNELKHAQSLLYNSLIPMLKEKHPDDWALVVDLDEFLYARLPEKVSSFLSKVPDDICQVHIRWKIFGSSGHVSQPKGGVRCSFTRCGVEARKRHGRKGICGYHINSKSAVKVSKLSSFKVHSHVMNPGCGAYYETNGLQLNHYRIQSKEWFEKVKMGKGDVAKGGLDQIRTLKYFESNDKTSSDFEDTELCSMLNCCVS